MKDQKNELVVFAVRRREGKCDECGDDIGRGGFLRKEGDRGLCVDCADLGDLVFLGAGDPALTRRATKYSSLRARDSVRSEVDTIASAWAKKS